MASDTLSNRIFHNPSPTVLKNIASNSGHKTVRFSITPNGVYAGDAYTYCHGSLYNEHFEWEDRGYVTKCDDGKFYYIAFKDKPDEDHRMFRVASHHEYLKRLENFGMVRGIMFGWDGVVVPANGLNPLKRHERKSWW